MSQINFVNGFAGRFKATAYAFGCAAGGPPALSVHNAPTLPGSTALTLAFGYAPLLGSGAPFYPLATNAPISVGADSNVEIITPTAVSANSPAYGAMNFTATFANAHGEGDPISSATFGLQEAINAAAASGGGVVVVDSEWMSIGGTTALIQAAVLPINGTVTIEDLRSTPILVWSNQPASLSVVAAPSAATSGTVASLTGVTGTWTSGTVHAVFSYVTANGGESLTSSDYSFTATASLAIGGSGPAAATGAVGYRVYLSTVGGSTDYQVPLITGNGTLIQCGPILAFKIGTPFSCATAVTSALALVPAISNSFTTVQPQPTQSPALAQPFSSVQGPFAATGVVTAGTAAEWGRVQIPTGFLNFVNRTLRITLLGTYTPVSTATLIINLLLESVYGTTSVTLYTSTSAATSGTTASVIKGEIYLVTAATGTTGTIECHGAIEFGSATASTGIAVVNIDNNTAASSTIDLTKQDAIVVQINSGTANLTTSQLRRMIVEVLA